MTEQKLNEGKKILDRLKTVKTDISNLNFHHQSNFGTIVITANGSSNSPISLLPEERETIFNLISEWRKAELEKLTKEFEEL